MTTAMAGTEQYESGSAPVTATASSRVQFELQAPVSQLSSHLSGIDQDAPGQAASEDETALLKRLKTEASDATGVNSQAGPSSKPMGSGPLQMPFPTTPSPSSRPFYLVEQQSNYAPSAALRLPEQSWTPAASASTSTSESRGSLWQTPSSVAQQSAFLPSASAGLPDRLTNAWSNPVASTSSDPVPSSFRTPAAQSLTNRLSPYVPVYSYTTPQDSSSSPSSAILSTPSTSRYSPPTNRYAELEKEIHDARTLLDTLQEQRQVLRDRKHALQQEMNQADTELDSLLVVTEQVAHELTRLEGEVNQEFG
ncbi:hypothetical protein ACM66B_002824 [Microbotryomycetes sp. NB124-2]